MLTTRALTKGEVEGPADGGIGTAASDERRTSGRGGTPPRPTGAPELRARLRLDANPLGFARLLVPLVLDDRCRAVGTGTLLIDQPPELLVETLLVAPLARHPTLVTHVRPPPLDRG
jgi:hypothetical protein